MPNATALAIIQDAYARMNRLSPGEALSADDAAFAFARLNVFVDELAGQNLYLFHDVLTSNVQSGPITLGTAPWAGITPGDEIVSVTQNNVALSPITMQQYNELYQPGIQGPPSVYAVDGFATVYFWPVPNGQTIKIQSRTGIQQFADQTTVYVFPDGWNAALGAGLAVRCAPAILGQIPASLELAEKRCLDGVDFYDPKIIDVDAFTGPRGYWPPRLF